MPLIITIEENEIVDFFRVDVDTVFVDSVINMRIESAKVEAEAYLNTDFSYVDEVTGETVTQEAPLPVKQWVLDRAVQLYESRGHAKETGRETRFVSAQQPDYTMLDYYRVYPFRG